MNKIILFILFIPLLFFSIYLGVTQYTNRKTNIDSNINTNLQTNPTATDNDAINEPTVSPALSQINLIVTSPESGTTVDARSITVSGTTKEKIDVVVNDIELTSGADGTFKVDVALDEGDNYISIVVYDQEGNVSEREILVTRAMSAN